MGVYIKGILKPESCHFCRFNYDWQTCVAKDITTYKLWDFNKHTPSEVYSECPLEFIDDEQLERNTEAIKNAWAITLKTLFKDEDCK